MARLVSDEVWAVLTIWQEARGEPYEGKLAVAEVIRNRMTKRWSGHGTVIDTVLAPFQFSGWNTGDPNRRRAAMIDDEDPTVQECQRAWGEALSGSAIVGEAVLYYNPALVATTPEWAVDLTKRVAVIGAQHFFTS